MVSENERAKILEMIEDGTITAEQGLTLLNALGESSGIKPENAVDDLVSNLEKIEDVSEVDAVDELTPPIQSTEPENLSTYNIVESSDKEGYQSPSYSEAEIDVIEPRSSPPDLEEMNKWKRWWVIPFWIGAGITVIGGTLMYLAYSGSGFGFWFACAWFPFLLGVAVLALGWGSRTTPWLHVRVHQAPGERPQNIAISFPIPIRLTAWGLRIFGHRIPHMEGTNLDEIVRALKDVTKDGTPLFIDVNEEEDGEHVQVFIG